MDRLAGKQEDIPSCAGRHNMWAGRLVGRRRERQADNEARYGVAMWSDVQYRKIVIKTIVSLPSCLPALVHYDRQTSTSTWMWRGSIKTQYVFFLDETEVTPEVIDDGRNHLCYVSKSRDVTGNIVSTAHRLSRTHYVIMEWSMVI